MLAQVVLGNSPYEFNAIIKNFIKDVRIKLKKDFPEVNMSNEQIAEFIYNMVKLKTTNNE